MSKTRREITRVITDRIKIRSKTRSTAGSISLEAAICLPLCLLILLQFCRLIYTYNAELNLKAATDAAAREASLVLTTAGLWSEVPDTARDYIQTHTKIDLPHIVDEWILELSMNQIQSMFILNRIKDFYEAEFTYPALGRELIQNTKLTVSRDTDESVLVLDLNYEVSVFGMRVERSIQQLAVMWHPLPTLSEENSGVPSEVWSLDNFSRGQILQRTFGRNLPSNYPVFAIYDRGRATAIMSMDLTAPTYQDMDAIDSNIREKLYEIAGYDEPPVQWLNHEQYFNGQSIHTRVLMVILPTNSPQEGLDQTRNMRRVAQELGINLIIKQAADSKRYLDD